MVKFYGKPLEQVKSALTGTLFVVFDTKGEYFTDDEKIIAKMKPHYKNDSNKFKCKYGCGFETDKLYELKPHYKQCKGSEDK